MNVVDSSAWLEYFANGSNASFFAGPIEAIDELVVPSLTIYEVFKRVLQQRDESHALRAVAVMQQGAVIDPDVRLALSAARLSLDTRRPMADSVVFATARLASGDPLDSGCRLRKLAGEVRYRSRKT